MPTKKKIPELAADDLDARGALELRALAIARDAALAAARRFELAMQHPFGPKRRALVRLAEDALETCRNACCGTTLYAIKGAGTWGVSMHEGDHHPDVWNEMVGSKRYNAAERECAAKEKELDRWAMRTDESAVEIAKERNVASRVEDLFSQLLSFGTGLHAHLDRLPKQLANTVIDELLKADAAEHAPFATTSSSPPDPPRSEPVTSADRPDPAARRAS